MRQSLEPLAASLAHDLEPLLGRELYFPREKALLSREGGRCTREGALLDFDPFQPHEHRCPRCGTVYRGELHDRFWIYWYQLWLAERAVHAAALSVLGVDDRFAPLAAAILDGYVERYETYPNVDNVLGPTRLFFSTYLESIWLLQIGIATDLLSGSNPSVAGRVIDRIVQPSRRIIAEYDEGGSNRQVWNDAALLAAARLVGNEEDAELAVHGPSGIGSHLSGGLLADGSWFEGENYHLFAHRGLWYGVTMAEQAGIAIDAPLLDRFQRGFVTPFATALPDFTLPSRRDSQYAISLRQWRIAEHCELGLARREDPELIGALARMYEPGHERRDTGRSRSSADAERNAQSSGLTRADLSWRALLCALPSLPPLEPVSPRSVLLEGQGIAVFRRNAGAGYVALDYGHSGGGHGHPDRLNLLVADGVARWLDDYGTGSYTDPSLHWYRSTLAHNAPLADGRSQQRVNGTLLAYDERPAAGWIVGTSEIANGVRATRTVVVLSEYLVDVVEWDADHEATIDLPFHANIVIDDDAHALIPAELEGGDGLEDGFEFPHDVGLQRVEADFRVHGVERRAAGRALHLWSKTSAPCEWWRAVAPGPPSGGERTFRIVRTRGARGRVESVLAWSDEVAAVDLTDGIQVTLRDGSKHNHRRTELGWQVEIDAGRARSSIDLAGLVPEPTPTGPEGSPAEQATVILPAPGESTTIELGERHYRRSEQRWSEIRPTALITLASSGESLLIRVDVHGSEMTFVPADAANTYDNEPADINGDGVQLYVDGEAGLNAWMLIPEPDSSIVRVRSIEGSTSSRPIAASWQPTDDGYRMDIELHGPPPESLDVIVNEMPRGRTRRRGQLVLSGAQGEFIYLRGDRHERARLARLRPRDV